jgi:hypothetical protein
LRRRAKAPVLLQADPRWADLCVQMVDRHVYGRTSALPLDVAFEVLGRSASARAREVLVAKLPIATWEAPRIWAALRDLGDPSVIPALERILKGPCNDDTKHWVGFTIAELRSGAGEKNASGRNKKKS